MVRPGKQPADAESSLDQREAPERVGARPALAERHQPPCPWLQPDAPSASQRQAASAAAAVKRKAGAMPEAERKAKHAERNRLSRAAKKVNGSLPLRPTHC